jgi:hypothetical protein
VSTAASAAATPAATTALASTVLLGTATLPPASTPTGRVTACCAVASSRAAASVAVAVVEMPHQIWVVIKASLDLLKPLLPGLCFRGTRDPLVVSLLFARSMLLFVHRVLVLPLFLTRLKDTVSIASSRSSTCVLSPSPFLVGFRIVGPRPLLDTATIARRRGPEHRGHVRDEELDVMSTFLSLSLKEALAIFARRLGPKIQFRKVTVDDKAPLLTTALPE